MAARPSPANARLFGGAAAKRIKEEICATGRKLWLRRLVEGNGGNLSCRVGPNEVICTPTLVSKYDLTPADLCMVDLDGNQIAGKRQATSEILLHLEIYKNVPQARAVVHCHPPHANAYAVTGLRPPTMVVPEYEVFVGQIAVAPYETPGTPEFARSVLPQVRHHNAMLLTNHGAVTWADSVTAAEWYCEVLETYCEMLLLAGQTGAPLRHIPECKRPGLAARRRKLGLPEVEADGALPGVAAVRTAPARAIGMSASELDRIVERVTREVLCQMGIIAAPSEPGG